MSRNITFVLMYHRHKLPEMDSFICAYCSSIKIMTPDMDLPYTPPPTGADDGNSLQFTWRQSQILHLVFTRQRNC
jgi:hypothetical protein